MYRLSKTLIEVCGL